MARVKVLVSFDPDVLDVIDARAASRQMTRSAYLAACALGLLSAEPIDDDESNDGPAPRK